MNDGTLKVAQITPIDSKQPQAQCEFKIQATLRGFPIEITGSGRAADLMIIVDRLFDLGAEPPAVRPRRRAAGRFAKFAERRADEARRRASLPCSQWHDETRPPRLVLSAPRR